MIIEDVIFELVVVLALGAGIGIGIIICRIGEHLAKI